MKKCLRKFSELQGLGGVASFRIQNRQINSKHATRKCLILTKLGPNASDKHKDHRYRTRVEKDSLRRISEGVY